LVRCEHSRRIRRAFRLASSVAPACCHATRARVAARPGGEQAQGPGISTTKCRRYGTALADMASPRVRATSAQLATGRRAAIFELASRKTSGKAMPEIADEPISRCHQLSGGRAVPNHLACPVAGHCGAAGGKNVETPHPVETSHAYSVFYFRRMQSFHANRAARLRWPDRYLAHGSQGHHASPQLTELTDISHRHCSYPGEAYPWKHNAAMRQRTRAHKQSVIYPRASQPT
jgi:hypothetical protein